MNTEVDQTESLDAEKEDLSADAITELSEDMEVVSPGAMLLEARNALSFSQEYIAQTLNFKVSLVKSIEEDSFDPALPATFNRGYLANYAKLVGIDVVDVLASYDALDAATIQRSEMLSFSKETTKQAEHSRVMWISYLIIAVFIGLTILWWLQESNQQEVSSVISQSQAEVATLEKQEDLTVTPIETEQVEGISTSIDNSAAVEQNEQRVEQLTDNGHVASSSETILSESLQAPPPVMSTAVFTFKGDCWVNIFDAKGERIAWGVKKAGYVMSIEGEAPLKITVGKPELTSITFNGDVVDMSAFNVGNIAKFNLPLGEYTN